jgi:hypothetical protein
MTHCLPPSLLRLFEPREPLPYSPPLDRDPINRTGPQIDPISHYLHTFQTYNDIPNTSIFVPPQKRKRLKVSPFIILLFFFSFYYFSLSFLSY